MRAGRIDEAGALARQTGKYITRRECTRLRKIGSKADSGDIWAAVQRLTGRHQHIPEIPGVDSGILNNYYATISTNHDYRPLSLKNQPVKTYKNISQNGRYSKFLIFFDQQQPD
jgi:hypothetical protein